MVYKRRSKDQMCSVIIYFYSQCTPLWCMYIVKERERERERVCVCMHACVCTCVWTSMYICTHTCVWVYVCASECVFNFCLALDIGLYFIFCHFNIVHKSVCVCGVCILCVCVCVYSVCVCVCTLCVCVCVCVFSKWCWASRHRPATNQPEALWRHTLLVPTPPYFIPLLSQPVRTVEMSPWKIPDLQHPYLRTWFPVHCVQKTWAFPSGTRTHSGMYSCGSLGSDSVPSTEEGKFLCYGDWLPLPFTQLMHPCTYTNLHIHK